MSLSPEEIRATLAVLETKMQFLEKKVDNNHDTLVKKIDEEYNELSTRLDDEYREIRDNSKALEKYVDDEIGNISSEFNKKIDDLSKLTHSKIEDKDIKYIRLIVYGIVAMILVAVGTALVNIVVPKVPANTGVIATK